MGTSTLLDIMGSLIIGGMLMLNMMRAFNNTSQQSAQFTSEYMVQRNLVELTSMLEYDFRKIGYQRGQENLAYAANALKSVAKEKIEFYADLDNNGSQETVEYSVGSKSALTKTPNPDDLPFFRKINGAGVSNGSYGIVELRFEYFDYTGGLLSLPISNLGTIATISITVTCESPFFNAQQENYNATAYWKQIRLAIPNLRYK